MDFKRKLSIKSAFVQSILGERFIVVLYIYIVPSLQGILTALPFSFCFVQGKWSKPVVATTAAAPPTLLAPIVLNASTEPGSLPTERAKTLLTWHSPSANVGDFVVVIQTTDDRRVIHEERVVKSTSFFVPDWLPGNAKLRFRVQQVGQGIDSPFSDWTNFTSSPIPPKIAAPETHNGALNGVSSPALQSDGNGHHFILSEEEVGLFVLCCVDVGWAVWGALTLRKHTEPSDKEKNRQGQNQVASDQSHYCRGPFERRADGSCFAARAPCFDAEHRSEGYSAGKILGSHGVIRNWLLLVGLSRFVQVSILALCAPAPCFLVARAFRCWPKTGKCNRADGACVPLYFLQSAGVGILVRRGALGECAITRRSLVVAIAVFKGYRI